MSATKNDVQQLTVADDDDGQRLDRWLKKAMPGVPYALLQKMMRTGQVRVNGKRAKAETRLESGQTVSIRQPSIRPRPAASRSSVSIAIRFLPGRGRGPAALTD